jgi:hypothetical protein
MPAFLPRVRQPACSDCLPRNRILYLRFEVLMAVKLSAVVFWIVTSCRPSDGRSYQTARHNNPEDSHIHTLSRENLISHLGKKLFPIEFKPVFFQQSPITAGRLHKLHLRENSCFLACVFSRIFLSGSLFLITTETKTCRCCSLYGKTYNNRSIAFVFFDPVKKRACS